MFPRLISSLHFVILILCFGIVLGMRCEDEYGKNYNGNADSLAGQQILKEIESMKNSMENLMSRQSVTETKIQDLPMFDARYDTLPDRCKNQKTPHNCGEATACTQRSGYYFIQIKEYSNDSFLVECDDQSQGGDWTVIQRRHDGSVDFYRAWSEYKSGFGDVNGEFFIGLDKLYALTNYDGPQVLLILMENATNSAKGQAVYDSFAIGNEEEKYMLKGLGRYSGDTKDSLRYHLGGKFSTKDQDNDVYSKNCAESFMGAWWYKDCHNSNLNGHYGDAAYAKGINWLGITDHYSSLKYVKMMIRRRRN